MTTAFIHKKTWGLLLACFALTITLNVTLWSSVRNIKVEWSNVPPTPGLTGALWSSLGDPQLAYRVYGIMIQNMGDTGGRVINLRKYDYDALGRWFHLQHELDPRSDFTPYLAGYFFGGVREAPEKVKPVIDYLEQAAGTGQGEKWRFLVHAIFLARYRMNDMDKALELAQKLASFDNPDMPSWSRQMQFFIMNAKGEKQAAYEMMVNLLKTEGANLHPNEVNATLAYICEQILTPDQAALDPICRDMK
ncbi:MAG: hypothetical protein H6861_00225 [Rhodospirillales bacterium]|nr:hypothetical protein [Rhodospirillales bacterium]